MSLLILFSSTEKRKQIRDFDVWSVPPFICVAIGIQLYKSFARKKMFHIILREKIAFIKIIYFNPIAEMLKHKYWNCNPIPPISQNIDTS
jgi:hypothetical protein